MLQSKPAKSASSRLSKRRYAFRLPFVSAFIGEALGAFLLSFAQMFGIPSPFSLTFIAALGQRGESPLASLAGLCVAAGMRLLWRLPLDIWPLVGGVLLAAGRSFYYNKRDQKAYLWCGLALLPRVVYAFAFTSPADGLLALVSLLMGIVALPAFRQVLELFTTSKDTLEWDDKLCLGLLVGLILCALGYLHLFRINLGLITACLLCLCLSHASGSDAASLGGLLCGVSLALCGHGSFPVLTLTSAGLLAGLARNLQSRFKTVLVFALSFMLAAVIAGSINLLYDAAAMLIACLAFGLVTHDQLNRLNSLVKQIKPHAQIKESTYASDMLRQWEDAIGEMAQNLPQVEEDITEPQHLLRHSLCEGCQRFSICWEASADAALPHQIWEAAQEDEAALLSWADATECPCPHLDGAFNAVTQIYAQLEQQRLAHSRARLEQAMIRTHLQAMAHAVRRLSAISQGESLSDLKGVSKMERILKETNFPARLVYARRPGGRLQCLLESETLAFTRWQPQRLISDLWTHGGLSMEITHLERSRMYLEETPSFRLQTGSATLGMEEDNGDGILCMRLPGGRYLLALSDGMGHGTSACRQSRETLNLLRLCLTAGYTRSQAITAVNGMMLSATGGSTFATVDLWTIDLWSGLAQADKLGACQSCLWRGDKLRFVEGAALPLGILEEVTPQSCQLRLADNDLLLIFSDGIADAFPSQEDLATAVARSVYQDPQRTADALLRLALISAGGIPKDDMTVLAARLTQWSAPAPISSSSPD